MSLVLIRHLVIGIAALIAAGMGCVTASVTPARADTVNTFNIDVADCSGAGCGEPAGFNFGTVTTDLNSAHTQLTYTFNLTTGLIVEPSGSETRASAAVDATGHVTSYSVSSNNSFGTWKDVSDPKIDGSTWIQGVACSIYGGDTCGTELVIKFVGTNLGVGAIDNWFAALDIYNSVDCQWYTGVVEATATPLPSALALLGPVLGIGYVSQRKRHKKLDASAS